MVNLGAYGFEKDTLTYMKNYLSNRLQRDRINSSFSGWNKIFSGIPQGSILGPLLCNISSLMIYLFSQQTPTSTVADDNTFFANGKKLEEIK